VTLVDQDHIGWKYWKLIARTISPSPFVGQRSSAYLQENMGIWRRLEVGLGKSGVLEHKATIPVSLKCVKISEKLLWMAYRNPPNIHPSIHFICHDIGFARYGALGHIPLDFLLFRDTSNSLQVIVAV